MDDVYGPLADSEFKCVLIKAIAAFEERTAHIDVPAHKAKQRSSLEEWAGFRCIIQFWLRAGQAAAKADMTQEDFEEHDAAILRGTALDQDILSMLSRGPSAFHVGMLPSFHLKLSAAASSQAELIKQETAKAAKSRYELFAAKLAADHETLREFVIGHGGLQDLLAWLEIKHKRKVVEQGADLVREFMLTRFMFIGANHVDGVLGEIADAVQSLTRRFNRSPKIIVRLDFNTPHVRDSLKLPKLARGIHFCLSQHQAGSIALLLMPDFPKEHSTHDADDEEAAITKACRALKVDVSKRFVVNIERGPQQTGISTNHCVVFALVGLRIYACISLATKAGCRQGQLRYHAMVHLRTPWALGR